MSTTKVLLGRKIRELRKSKGWTQEYLSELLGVNAKSVLRIESGQTFPTVQNLEKLSAIFGVKMSDLFNYESLEELEIVKKNINEILQTLSEPQIRNVYKFLNSIK